jgi:hypothetical protein
MDLVERPVSLRSRAAIASLTRIVLAPGRQLGFLPAQPAQFWPTIPTASPRETARAFPGPHNCLPTGHDAFIPGLTLRFRPRQASSNLSKKHSCHAPGPGKNQP